jgi:DNA-binding transcriptional MerR regulator/methylmalonyl-CoA mutase cobalamin-binding subunit
LTYIRQVFNIIPVQGNREDIQKRFSMKVASRMTGLTPHAIRAWERRYGVVSPGRDSNNRRFYSESDIERLSLLHKATVAGYPISQITGYSKEELQDIIDRLNVIDMPQRRGGETLRTSDLSIVRDYNSYIDGILSAIEHMNPKELGDILAACETETGRNALLEQVVIPVMERVGELWRKGELRISHEHLATQTMRTFLGSLLSSQQTFTGAPHAVVTTPSDQVHEIGALSAAVAASSEGWNVTYLGPSLPADEIAGAVTYNNSGALILSLVYPESDPLVSGELRKLRRYLPAFPIIVGGRAKQSYSRVLAEIEAVAAESLYDMRTVLESIRTKGTF